MLGLGLALAPMVLAPSASATATAAVYSGDAGPSGFPDCDYVISGRRVGGSGGGQSWSFTLDRQGACGGPGFSLLHEGCGGTGSVAAGFTGTCGVATPFSVAGVGVDPSTPSFLTVTGVCWSHGALSACGTAHIVA